MAVGIVFAPGARAIAATAAGAAASLRFDLGPGKSVPGWTAVGPGTVYSDEGGFGFEPVGAALQAFAGGDDPLRGDGIAAAGPFFFSVRVPAEGNFRVTVTLGRPDAPSRTTIKAELRRLMLEDVRTSAGATVQRSFIVNTRTPRIAARGDIAAGEVRLKAPRETTQEAWAWDDRLTLEFNGAHPAVAAIEIERVEVPTIFLLGDSTVCDQSREPYASWGQMLPVFFKPGVAVANHGESGETYRDSLGRRRLDKILSVMQPGDFVIMQFGHNDQKQLARGTGGPFTTYAEEMRRHIAAIRAHGGNPVLVTPMERRHFDAAGRIVPSLGDYPAAVRRVAREEVVPLIDLNVMSIAFYEALGPDGSAAAFARTERGLDATHHNNYGAYELARCVVRGIREMARHGEEGVGSPSQGGGSNRALARWLRDDLAPFDPAHPDPVATFDLPASPRQATDRPPGS